MVKRSLDRIWKKFAGKFFFETLVKSFVNVANASEGGIVLPDLYDVRFGQSENCLILSKNDRPCQKMTGPGASQEIGAGQNDRPRGRSRNRGQSKMTGPGAGQEIGASQK